MAHKDLKITNDFKFSEEIFTVTNVDLEKKENEKPYEIIFDSDDKCEITPKNPALNNTNKCKNCYYQKFAEKLISTRKSKRTDFILYQMSLRKEKSKFITEIKEFLIDNEEYFNNEVPWIVYDYQEILVFIESGHPKGYKYVSYPSLGNLQSDKPEIINIDVKHPDIFISHSSADKDLADKLIILIRSAMRIEPTQIRCTSIAGHKLVGGSNVDQNIREDVRNCKVLLGIISTKSLDSLYVIFELGARWGLKKPMKPLIYDSKTIHLIDKPLNNMHLIDISSEDEIHQLISELSVEIEAKMFATSTYLQQIKDLLNLIELKNNDNKSIFDLPSGNNELTYSTVEAFIIENANEKDNVLSTSKSKDGFILQTSSKELKTKDVNTQVLWQNALVNLEKRGIIQAINESGTKFSIIKKNI